MAATVSPWAKPGAWALDSEEHEAELLQHKAEEDDSYSRREPEPRAADFPSLSVAAATKPKKKKGQTLSLAEFSSFSSAKTAFQPSHSRGVTHEDLMSLPTGPRQRTAEELDRTRLGGGFRSYGSNDRGGRYSNGDDSSNSRWGSSRVSDETRKQGGFGRDSSRESAPSRADEIDDWGAAKKSMVGNGFERKERGGGGGFFDSSQSKADESDNWVSNKSFVPSEGRRFAGAGGGFDRERRGGGGFESLTNGGGADSESWGKKKEDGSGIGIGIGSGSSGGGSGRPRLNLQPRTLPVSNGQQQEGSGAVAKPKGSNPFGEARPREEVLAEKGQDWKKIDEQLESAKIKEVGSGGSPDGPSFVKRSFGSGNGRASLPETRTERSWRKPDSVDVRPPSAEKSENGSTTEEN
ncbi:hypothetical protein L1049_015777 [Liquidambar formosana]|uniref:Eukaryotic translation initiation factor 4B3 n=1 Tax=Liquidambar formosana TaxID=63359 RepID=A0AAP0S5E8_LIQFO